MCAPKKSSNQREEAVLILFHFLTPSLANYSTTLLSLTPDYANIRVISVQSSVTNVNIEQTACCLLLVIQNALLLLVIFATASSFATSSSKYECYLYLLLLANLLLAVALLLLVIFAINYTYSNSGNLHFNPSLQILYIKLCAFTTNIIY